MAELNVPEPLLVKVIVPVGVVTVPDEVSEMVAVQVEAAFTASGEVQLMLVDVDRLMTVRLKVPEPELWSVSPP